MFVDQICERLKKTSPIVVGIDPNLKLFPEILLKNLNSPDDLINSLFNFSKIIIDATCELSCALKFQSAYFEQFGTTGLIALAKSLAYAKNAGQIIILDVKRADIGSTSAAYAKAYLGADKDDLFVSDLKADALTINPFLGPDSMEPFFERAALNHKAVFVLVKTSNSGSEFIQNIKYENNLIYEKIARYLAQISLKPEHLGQCGLSNIGAVVGATFLDEAKIIQELMPRSLLLVPGVGSQGASLYEVNLALHHRAIFPISRSITYFAKNFTSFNQYQEAVQQKTLDFIAQLG